MIKQANPLKPLQSTLPSDAIDTLTLPKIISKDQFAFFNWGTLAVGDTVEGIGMVRTPLEKALILEMVPKILLDCFMEIGEMDDQPDLRLKKMIALSREPDKKKSIKTR